MNGVMMRAIAFTLALSLSFADGSVAATASYFRIVVLIS
jgi:hypothetical protein